MEIREQITERVHDYYWKDNINCATTTLMILAELFRIDCGSQVLDSAIGMHGAAEYGAQCGLAEGRSGNDPSATLRASRVNPSTGSG